MGEQRGERALIDSNPEASSALERLATRYRLGEGRRAQLASLLSVLEGDERAPTAVRSAARAVEVHLADSLIALELEVVRAAHTIADLGSGAGFPGLALAVALAPSEVRLIESQMRKYLFLNEMLAAAGIENARAVCVRAEEWRDGACAQELIVARALAAQPVVLEYAAPLLALGGTLVDWRGARTGRGEDAALRAAEELGMRRLEVRRVEPYEGAREHHLHLFVKVAQTPARFPRRAGVARKRPLGLRAPVGGDHDGPRPSDRDGR
ncbi:MAG: RsmG family class I SAM-dependent methyltransferase [Solirubrobacteraceae bacterium]|jgi:16S rRNA (guanine527-N7)-methyltransferase